MEARQTTPSLSPQDQGAKMAETKRPDGVISLIDGLASQLISLDEALDELEKIVSPVMELSHGDEPASPEKESVPPSPVADRPDHRLRFINDELTRKVNHVRRLCRNINI